MTSPALQAALLIVGYHVTSPSAARRHVEALDLLLDELLPGNERERLQEIRKTLVDRYGYQSPDPEKCRAVQGIGLVQWIMTRHDRARSFHTIQKAARLLLQGETSVGILQSKSFGFRGQELTAPVRQPQFTRWLLLTRVAVKEERGVYRPGPDCEMAATTEWPVVKEMITAATAAKAQAEAAAAEDGHD